MDFNEYLKKALNEDDELKREYDSLQPEYEMIRSLINMRIKYDLTQKELAQKCGVKQSNISRIESGKGNPTLKFLKKIANAMDCDLVIEFRKREPITELSTYTQFSNEIHSGAAIESNIEKFQKIGSTQRESNQIMSQSALIYAL